MANKVFNEENRKITLSVTIKKRVIEELERFCKENKVSKSQVTEDALESYIKELESIPLGREMTKEEIDKQVEGYRVYLKSTLNKQLKKEERKNNA